MLLSVAPGVYIFSKYKKRTKTTKKRYKRQKYEQLLNRREELQVKRKRKKDKEIE